jgi:hypothetical protein
VFRFLARELMVVFISLISLPMISIVSTKRLFWKKIIFSVRDEEVRSLAPRLLLKRLVWWMTGGGVF